MTGPDRRRCSVGFINPCPILPVRRRLRIFAGRFIRHRILPIADAASPARVSDVIVGPAARS